MQLLPRGLEPSTSLKGGSKLCLTMPERSSGYPEGVQIN